MNTENAPERAPVSKPVRVKDEAYRERQRAYMREYAKRKADQIKAYREENKELIQEIGAAYRAKHRDSLNERRRQWGEENKDRVAAKNTEWRKENPERFTEAQRRWREENPDKQAESSKSWRSRNGARVQWHARMRVKHLEKATPAWADFDKMNAFYVESKRMTEETGERHVVDHIVPLRGKLVCGLHCEANLQVITYAENARKGNKFVLE